MWVVALNVLTLILMLVALCYFLFSSRKLDQALTEMLEDQGEQLRRIERDLDRVRHALDSVSTGVMTLDIRQRLKQKS